MLTKKEMAHVPEVYVVPSVELPSLKYTSPKGRKIVPLSRVRREGKKYKDA
jgi:hypothetical protein